MSVVGVSGGRVGAGGGGVGGWGVCVGGGAINRKESTSIETYPHLGK